VTHSANRWLDEINAEILPPEIARPMPRIFKGGNLRPTLDLLGRFKEEIVVAFGVERQIEVNEIDGLVFDVLAENVEVVDVVERFISA